MLLVQFTFVLFSTVLLSVFDKAICFSLFLTFVLTCSVFVCL